MSLADFINSLTDALETLLQAFADFANHIARSLGSVLDDSPIGWSYYEEERYAVSTDGRWVDRKTEEYSEWLVCDRKI